MRIGEAVILAGLVLLAGISASVWMTKHHPIYRPLYEFLALLVSAIAWYLAARGEAVLIQGTDLAPQGDQTRIGVVAAKTAEEFNRRLVSGLNMLAAAGALGAIAFSSDLPSPDQFLK